MVNMYLLQLLPMCLANPVRFESVLWICFRIFSCLTLFDLPATLVVYYITELHLTYSFHHTQGIITGRPRNCSAHCADGCVLLEMSGRDFLSLTKQSPDIMSSLRDLSLRRDFKKAVVHRLQKEFPYDHPQEAYDAVMGPNSTSKNLQYNDISTLMRELHPEYTDDDILEIIRVLALTNTSDVSFDEFKKVFVADIRLSASV
jgi:hypothetical protein